MRVLLSKHHPAKTTKPSAGRREFRIEQLEYRMTEAFERDVLNDHGISITPVCQRVGQQRADTLEPFERAPVALAAIFVIKEMRHSFEQCGMESLLPRLAQQEASRRTAWRQARLTAGTLARKPFAGCLDTKQLCSRAAFWCFEFQTADGGGDRIQLHAVSTPR